MKVVNENYKDKYLKYKNKYYNIKTNNYKQKGGDMLFYFSSLSIVGIILWFIFKNPTKETNDLKKIEKEINKIPFLGKNTDNIRINTSDTNSSSIDNQDNISDLPVSDKDKPDELGTGIRDDPDDDSDVGDPDDADPDDADPDDADPDDADQDDADQDNDDPDDADQDDGDQDNDDQDYDDQDYDDPDDTDQDFTEQPTTEKRGFFERMYDRIFGQNKNNATDIDEQLLREHEKDKNYDKPLTEDRYELDESISNFLLRLYNVGLYESSEILSVVDIIIKDKSITLKKALQILQSKYTKIKKNDVVLILDNPNGNAISLAVVDKVNIGNPHTYNCTIVKPLEEQNEDLFISINDKQKLFKLPKHKFFTKKGILFYLYSDISNGKNIEERYDKLFKCLEDYYKQSKNKKNNLNSLEKCIEKIFDKSHVSNIQIDEVIDPDDDEVVDTDDDGEIVDLDNDSIVQDNTLALTCREINESENEQKFLVSFEDKVSIANIDEVLELINEHNVRVKEMSQLSDIDKMSGITIYKSLTLPSEKNLMIMNRAYEKALSTISDAKKALIQDKYYDIMNLKHLPQPSFLIETQYLEALYVFIDECLSKLENENANLKGVSDSNFMKDLSESINNKDPDKFLRILEYILDSIERIKSFLNEIKSTLNDHNSGFTERLMAIEDESIPDKLMDEIPENILDNVDDDIELTKTLPLGLPLGLPSNNTNISEDYQFNRPINQDDIDDLLRLFNNNPNVTNEHLDILFDIIHSCMEELEKNNDVDFMKIDFSEIYSDFEKIDFEEFSILNKLSPDTAMLKKLRTEIISNTNKIKSFLKEIYEKDNLNSASSFMNKLRAYEIVVDARRLTMANNKGGVIVFSMFDKWNDWHNNKLIEDNKELDKSIARLEVVNRAIKVEHDTNITELKEEQLVLNEKIKSLQKKIIEREYTSREFIRQREFLSK